jgi:hypothetical protein
MKFIRRIAVIFLVAVTGCGVPADVRKFEDERLALVRSIHQVLIAKGLCADGADCTRKQFVFAGPEYHGLSVELYQITDPAVVSDITKLCAAIVMGRPDMSRLELKIYPISKTDHLAKPIFSRTPYKTVNFEN